MNNFEIKIPLSIPNDKIDSYLQNYANITHQTGKLFLFAGDQKIEHLNKDFSGKNISKDDADPEHLFKIASKGKVGAFATQLGLISRYGHDYPDINYIVKLNSKTDLVPTKQKEPISALLNTVEDVVKFKDDTNISIAGIGFTIYLGSENEHVMLAQAAQEIFKAHQNGLVAILWVYPRGKAIKNEKDPDLIAGACGIASALGADFVKINSPGTKYLKKAVVAAGRTKVICAGGKAKKEIKFLKELYEQIHKGEVWGCAIGRNIHQKDLDQAVKFCAAISAITNYNMDIEKAKKHL
jgi:fructose-bisphosphate aldolase / 6-deoxy-5-ketofructose 1-phosphate synthase